MTTIGIQGLLTLVTYVFFVGLTFWVVNQIHIERFIPIRELPGKLLIVLLSVSIGWACSSFFLSVIDNIRNLIFLVK
ncbi:DUF1146 family protein [Lentilactobacillus sp. Marseille-Q4993]|uniref:DUF1146 family protein n=1 Tax=Lentilactobacillus sp. Marseille-Q4993 TaxID=3039492 RepID=UPI0024BCCBBC|nr:DUF1146 family protein [Lentilactobacillus sp. Marseille-Q4993]